MLSLYDLLKARKTGIAPDLWTALAAKNLKAADVKETTGELPLIIKTNGAPLLDYRIYGNMVQNGIPSPENPIQPQDCGEMTENMFDCTRIDGIIAGSFINQNGNIIKNNEYYISYPIYVTEEKTYTWRFNADSYNTTHTSPTVGFYDASDNLLSVALHNSGIKYFSFNIPNGCKYIRCSVFTRDNIQRQAMLNIGSSPMRYTDFGYKIPISSGGATTSIYLGEVPTTRRVKKINCKTFKWEVYQAAANKKRFTALLSDGITADTTHPYSICSHIPLGLSGATFTTENCYTINADTKRIYFRLSDDIDTLSALDTFFNEQESKGTPVTIWYVLTEPETGIVNEPLRKIGDYTDTISMEQAQVQIPTNRGLTTIDVATTLKPSQAYIKYRG